MKFNSDHGIIMEKSQNFIFHLFVGTLLRTKIDQSKVCFESENQKR